MTLATVHTPLNVPTDVSALIEAHDAARLAREYADAARKLRVTGSGRRALAARMLKLSGVWRRTAVALTECAYA